MKKTQTLYEEYRALPQWYYHLTFDSLETGQLFYSDEDYAHGMNSVAIGQYTCKISIIAFNLMVNHCHILASGTGEKMVKFFSFMKRRLNDRLRTGGHPELAENYGFKLVRVEDERQLKDTIIYIARNPLKACPDIAPGGYPWGSTSLIFNKMNKYFSWIEIKDLSKREKERYLRTHVSLPDDYHWNKKLGLVLPESYVLTWKAEQVLGNSWNYAYDIVRKIDAYVKIAEGIGEMVILTDNELDEIIRQNVRKMFNADSVRELGTDDRCRLAVMLRNKYKVTPKRIARKLQINVATLNKLFG
jgi:REP element-mobilizing transposase RayT